MRKTKESLLLRDTAGKDNILMMTKQEIMNNDSFVASYHDLDNPSIHRVISSYEWKQLIIFVTSTAYPEYVDLILSRVREVLIFGEEKDLQKHMDTYIKFVPDKAAELRRAKMKGLTLTDVLKG